MWPIPFVLPVVMVAIAVAVIVLLIVYEKRRATRLEEICKELGLRFGDKDDDALLDAVSQFPLFSRGHSKKIKNVFHGEIDEREVAVFGYRYTTSSGQHSNTVKQTVIYFRADQMTLPKFELRPENLFHKIGQAFGYGDIDFESHPTFSKKYLLRAEDEGAIRKLFSERVLAFFEQHDGVNVEAHGNQLIYYRPGKRVSPDRIRSFMEEGFHVASLFRT